MSRGSRHQRAYLAARRFDIQSDENVAAFLRIEAYAPNFHEKPATRAWLTQPGRSADERFRDHAPRLATASTAASRPRVPIPSARASRRIRDRDPRTAAPIASAA
ncbi:hypothetical protein C6V07_24020 [Burkholderia gladioli]|nr:hypothetical protein C6V07_24020 [Burkholderia gladioli]